MPQEITRRGLGRHILEKVILTRDGRVITAPLFKEDNPGARLFIQVAKGTKKYYPQEGDDVQILVRDGLHNKYRHHTYAGSA